MKSVLASMVAEQRYWEIFCMNGAEVIVVRGKKTPCWARWAKGGQVLWELCKVCNR